MVLAIILYSSIKNITILLTMLDCRTNSSLLSQKAIRKILATTMLIEKIGKKLYKTRLTH